MTGVRTERFDVGDAPALSVDVRSGSVDVRVGESGRITVRLDGPDVEQWATTQLGDTVTVEAPARRSWRVRSIRLLVDVPEGTDVDVQSASADVTTSGSLGSVRVRTASGDVRSARSSRLEVRTASGAAEAREVEAGAVCSTASGDVAVGRVGGRLAVTTASGDVHVELATDDVQIGSASGDVRVDRYEGADISVKCISGDVVVGLPAGIRVEPDLSTLSGRTSLPEPASSPPPEPRRIVRIGIRTVSGDIALRRV